MTAMGNMGLRIQVPGRSYFSIELVLNLRRHTLCGLGSVFARRVAHLFSPVAILGVPKSDRSPVWRRRRFFISSVADSVLVSSAALESLCFGIGFGHLEWNLIYLSLLYYCVMNCIVLYICI